MNSPPENPKAAKATDVARPTPEISRDGLGLPHLSTGAANDSSLEPDQPADLDETVRKDKEAAEKASAAKPH